MASNLNRIKFLFLFIDYIQEDKIVFTQLLKVNRTAMILQDAAYLSVGYENMSTQ